MSTVFGLRLAGGLDVVIKTRHDDGRAASCIAAQARLAERGFPCARPLTPAVSVGALVVHAEEARPGGELLGGDSPYVAVRYAGAFARLMAELAHVTVTPPLPNPRWVRWDHTDPGVWPAIKELDGRDQGAVPAFVVDAAVRARKRMLAAELACVLGHADFEAQNLRWHSGELWVRGRRFSVEEKEVAWAASLWTAAHNARWEAVHGDAPVSCDAVRAQATERLRRANA